MLEREKISLEENKPVSLQYVSHASFRRVLNQQKASISCTFVSMVAVYADVHANVL